MKKSAKTNRKSRTVTPSRSQKLFRNGSQGFEALEPRQMLDAGLTNALFDTAIPYTEDALTHQSATVLTVKPTSETAEDGSSIYAGIRIYSVDTNATGDVAEINNLANGFTISKIEKVNADGTKSAISLLDANNNIQNSYSFACAQMLLGQEYSITVSWSGNGEAPKFGAVAYLMGDTDAFNSPSMSGNALPATDTLGNFIANQQSNISTNEINLLRASIMLDDPQTNWQHDQAVALLNSTGFTETDTYLFSLDSNTQWDSSDLTRVEANQKVGNVDFNMTFDQIAPGLSVTVSDGENFAGTAIVSEGSKVEKTEYYTCDVDTSSANPILQLNFKDNISAIKSIGISKTDSNYDTAYWSISGNKKEESVNLDLASYLEAALTEGTHNCYIQAIDAIGNTAIYVFNVNYKANADYSVENGSIEISGNADSDEDSTATSKNTSDEITVDINPNLKGGAEGDTTKQRMAILYNGTMYYTTYNEYTNTGSDWGKDTFSLTDFDGLAQAMGASEGVIPDGTYNFTAFIQDSFGHDAQQVGIEQKLVIDTTEPEFTFTINGTAVDNSSKFTLIDTDKSSVVVTLNNADASTVTVTLFDNTNNSTNSTVKISVNDTESTSMDIDNEYGLREFTLTATDAAGNVVTKTFTLYFNNKPTAADFTATVNEAQTPAYTAANGVALDFATAVADANTADSTLTVSVNAPTNGKLCVENADGSLSALVPANGKISFTADKTIYYVPNQYWFGSESLTYTVTDNFGTVYTDQSNATSDSATVSITINAVDSSLISPVYTTPTAVEEDSAAAEQTVATFSYPTNEVRDWSATAVWSNANVNKLNAGGGTDATSLFTTAPMFTVVADGEASNGIQNYKVVMSGWTLDANLWGTEDFTLTIVGAKATGSDAIADLSVTATTAQTFTVSSVNDTPTVDKGSIYNVSLSTLSKGDVTLAITDDMYSDIDDADADLTITKITVGETEIAQGSSAVIAINNVDVTFALDGKNIVISQNASKALDKGTITFAITVADNDDATATSTQTQLSTIKFSAYASDDTVSIKEDAVQTGFNVLKNDKTNSENWDGKTFTISQVNGYAVAVNVEITLTVDGKTAGVLKVLDLATAAEGENNFTFTPAADWNGTAAFVYTIVNSADSTETATATVTINVEAVNDYPTFTWDPGYAIVDSTDSSKATTTFGEDVADNLSFNFNIGTYTDIDTALADLESIVKENATLEQKGKISALDTEDIDLFTSWSLAVVTNDGAANQYFLQMTVALNPNVWGTATLKFTPTDAQQTGSQGILPVEHTLTINVTPVNDAPVTDDTEITIDEDADYTEIVLSTVSDVESPKENLFLQVTAPTNGKLYLLTGEGTEASPYVYTEMTYTEGVSTWITAEQKVFYKPNENYFGTDTFQYQIKDTLSDSGVTTGEAAVSGFSTFTVNITAVNDAPVFTPNTTDFTKATEGTDAGKYVINTNLNEDAASTTINLGKVSDVDTALASITISIQTVTSAGTKTSAAATADMSLFDATPSFAINTDGDLIMTYKLAADVSGYADITIQVDDNQTENNLSETFQFKLVVDPVNDAPVATDAAWGISIGALEKATTGITYDLAQNASDIDGDTLSISNVKIGGTTLTETAQNITVGEYENAVIVSASISDSVVTLAYVSGNIDKLDRQELGLTFTVSDGALTANGTGTITFSAYTKDDETQYTQIAEDATQKIYILVNDKANWGDKKFKVTAISALSDLDAGTISIVEDSRIDYVQAAGYRGTFTFIYTISEVDADGALVEGGETAEGTVTVLVKALNDTPMAIQVDASINESQTGTDKIKLDFSAAVADRETADANLTITIADNTVTNGTLVDSEGTAFTATDGKYTFAATTEVYFKPNQYYNGSVTIPYTVTDRLDAADFAGLTLADEETVETATSNAVVVVSAVGTTPMVVSEDKTVAEDSTATRAVVGTASMPTGAEALASVSAVTKGTITAHKLNDASDSLTALLADGYSFALNKATGEITFNYTLLENVYGSQTFTITVTTAEGGTKSFDWTFTVTSVNDAPTTTGVKQTGVVTDGTGTWSKTTAELKALILTASSDVDNTLTAEMITIPTADLPTGMTYDSGTDTYSLTTTMLSNSFTLTYTIDDGKAENNTVSGNIVISFNQAPVLNNFSGNKTIDTSVTFGEGSWILFNQNDVSDPDNNSASIHIELQSHADTSTFTSFNVSKDASNNYILSYNVKQGVFGSGYVDVVLTEKLDDNTDGASTTYRYVLSVTNTISIPLVTEGDNNDQKYVTAENPLYIDFANSGLTTSANSLDLNKLFGSNSDDAHTYTIAYDFSGGADYQKTSSSTKAKEYWTVQPTGTNVTTDATNYPVYKDGEILTDNNGNPLFWTLTPSSANSKAQSESYTGSDYPVMIRPSSANAVPVSGTITNSNLELKLNSYSAEQDNTGSVIITRDDGVAITININITPETTYNIQWFVTDDVNATALSKNSAKSVSLENWPETTAKKNNDLEYNAEHALVVYANDQFIEKINSTSAANMVYAFLIRIDFGGSIDLDGDSDYNVFGINGGFQNLMEWNEDNSVVELSYFVADANRANLEDFRWLGDIHYSYLDDTGTQIPTVSFRSVIRGNETGGGGTIMNSLQVSADWAEGTNPTSGAGLYGTESAEQTKVEGTGVYMQLSVDQPTAQRQQNLPQSETWIHEWQSHYVNMYANTQDGTIIDGRIYYELNYDSQYFTATDFIASNAMENSGFVLRNGKVYITGIVDNLDASNGFVLLGSVKFEALENNNVAADTVGSVDMGLSLSNISLNDANGNQIAVNTQTVVDTQLWAVVYDSDDSGAIDLNDFTYFAMNFNVNTVASNNTQAWAMDFDKSGQIDLNDFTSFAINVGVSRENGQTVQFPEGFEQQYIGIKLEGDGDAKLSELVDKAVQEWEDKLGIELNVSIQLKVTDFSDAQLGESYIVSLSGKGTPEIGTITLDANAAGLNWSINTADVADGQYDLYTVLLHEVGHLLGYTDQYSAFGAVARGEATIVGSHTTNSSDLMHETINPGERKEVSDADAKIVSDAYDYAKTNGATLTYVGSADLAAAMTGTDFATQAQPEIITLASAIVTQEDWTATLETKVLEELNRIATENRDSVFTESDSPILEEFNADEFAFNLAGTKTEDNGLFDDLSWISDESTEAEEKLDVELEQLL